MKNTIYKSYAKKILKSEAFVSVIIVFVLALGIIGTSYALYMDVDTDTNYQLVEVGDLSIGFNNGSDTISLENMTPTSDDIATGKVDSEIARDISSKNLTSFYIYNTGTYTAHYDIKLVPIEGNTVDVNNIKYQICRDNAQNCKDISVLGSQEDSIIYKDELTPNSTAIDINNTSPSAYYFLRIWIDENYSVTTTQTINLQIVIEAKNASGYLDNDNTLSGAILNNSNITINNTVPSFTGIADYKIKGNASSGEPGLYKAQDDYGVSYYFRGAQSYNYVNFAGFTWRIVRINGDGSIRLILNDSLHRVKREGLDVYAGTVSSFKSSPYNDNAYIGFMYGLAGVSTNVDRCLLLVDNIVTDKISEYPSQSLCEQNGGKWTTTAYEATHANVGSSTIKINLDTFYETYIENETYHYEKYLADSIICQDKSLVKEGIAGVNEHLGYSNNKSYYAGIERLWYSEGTTYTSLALPTLKCLTKSDNNYSRYTSKLEINSETSLGVSINNDLKHPIGLLSADELVMAGAFRTAANNNFYLNDVYKNETVLSNTIWWVISPDGFANNAYNFASKKDASLYAYPVGNENGVRPVINLKKDVLISGGYGTSAEPYTIKYN